MSLRSLLLGLVVVASLSSAVGCAAEAEEADETTIEVKGDPEQMPPPVSLGVSTQSSSGDWGGYWTWDTGSQRWSWTWIWIGQDDGWIATPLTAN